MTGNAQKYYHKITDSDGKSDIQLRYPLTEVKRSLPLVLVGPILRRLTPTSVTVWLALKRQQIVTLQIIDTSGQSPTIVMEGKRETVRVGEFLHFVVVEAKSTNSLDPGKIYQYEVQLGDKSLSDQGVLTTQDYDIDITYGNYSRPTFALLPTNIDDIHIMHTSCRKPHAPGHDALPAVDQMISSTAENPAERPHQLYLTGDQIYADDVADALLYLLTDAGETLLGWTERLPKDLSFWEKWIGQKEWATPTELKPGSRNVIADDQCNFTSHEAKSHLLGLGEYLAMYLFTWSDVLWPSISDYTPKFEEVYPGKKSYVKLPGSKNEVKTVPYTNYLKETRNLRRFQDKLKDIRRALANIPTYMIFDDHEVSDDWYLHKQWCIDVIKKSPMGRRVIENAHIAYALCQGWGNTPEQFSKEGSPGEKLLKTVIPDLPPTGDRNRDLVDRLLGIPTVGDQNILEWPAATDRILWHYRMTFGPLESIVLDTRTWRRFNSEKSPPELIGISTYTEENQLGSVPSPRPEITLLVAAAPFWIAPAHKLIKKFVGPEKGDAEDWHYQHAAQERLFAELAKRGKANNGTVQTRIVTLSGDVHYGYTVRMQGWYDKSPWTAEEMDYNLIITNLIASAAKNQDSNTVNFHNNGYSARENTIEQAIARSLTSQTRPPRLVGAGWIASKQSVQSSRPLIDGIPVSPSDLADLSTGMPTNLGWSWLEGINNLRENPTFAEYSSVSVDFIQRTLLSYDNKVRLMEPPNWRYRVDYLVDTDEITPTTPAGPEQQVPPPGTQERKEALQKELARLPKDDQEKYNRRVRFPDGTTKNFGVGREITGYNNVGEVSFNWSGDDKSVIHSLWWHLTPSGGLSLFPYQTITVQQGFSESKYPKPDLGWGQ